MYCIRLARRSHLRENCIFPTCDGQRAVQMSTAIRKQAGRKKIRFLYWSGIFMLVCVNRYCRRCGIE